MRYIIELKLKNIEIKIKDLEIAELNFTDKTIPVEGYKFQTRGEEVLYNRVKEQIIEYMNGERKTFSFQYWQKGTEFQNLVWEACSRIGYGCTSTYQELAASIGKHKAVRAVARALAENKLLILIPCHRVIGSDGKMRGYKAGVEIKEALLELEKSKLSKH